MNRSTIGLLMLLALVAGAAMPVPASAQVHASVNISFFYDSLSPYGQWVDNADYGYVWRPTRIATGWRPYMNGRWQYTEAGWAFDSYEPFGWATFHYGRWMYDRYYGWVWVPGTEWSPAWVDFQIGEGWVGWAALPPGVSIGASYGSGGYRSRIDARGYCFVDDRRFLESRVDRYVRPWDRNQQYLRDSRDASRFERYGGVVVNRGLPVERIERTLRRAVAPVRIIDVQSYSQIASRRERGFATYRPEVRARAEHRPARVYPSSAERRMARAATGDRLTLERRRHTVGGVPIQSLDARKSPRHAVEVPRRVVISRRVESRVVDVRPRGQSARVHGVGAPHQQVVRRELRELKTERRTVKVDRRQPQRGVQHPPKKQHGGGHGS